MPESLSDIRLFPLNSWDQVARGLESNDLNAAFMNIPQAMALSGQGMDIALLMFTHRGGSRMICPSWVKQIQDFKGKSVLIPHKLSVQNMLLHQFLARGMERKNTCSPDMVCAEQVPPGLMGEMTTRDTSGDIAAFICEAPFGAREIEQGSARQLLATSDLWPDHPSSAFVVRRELLDKKNEGLQNLIHTFFRSAGLIEAWTAGDKPSPRENRPLPDLPALAADFLKFPGRITTDALKNPGSSYAPELLVPDLKILGIIAQYMGETMGLLPGPLDLKTFIQPTYALTSLGEINR